MEYFHVQQLTEDFKSQDSLDYKFSTLIEISDHFRMEYNEELKRGLEENLRNKLRDLIIEFKSRVAKLEDTVATLRSPY